PSQHQDSNSSLALCIYGRVCLMFRDAVLNTSSDHIHWLCAELMTALAENDSTMSSTDGVVGFTRSPTLYTDLSPGCWRAGAFEAVENDPGNGEVLMLSFWAYGATEPDAFRNLDRLFSNLWAGSRAVNAKISVTENERQ